MSTNIFREPASGATPVLTYLQKREAAVRKAQRLPAPQNDPKLADHNRLRIQAVQANTQAIQEVKSWYARYNNELKSDFREYAHAQMEFAAKALEQWSNFVEDLTIMDFASDTDKIVCMLEQNGGVQAP
jgi:hypothetical protein